MALDENYREISGAYIKIKRIRGDAIHPGSNGNDSLFLHFAALKAWAFDPDTQSPCPDSIKALSGRREASCIGFIYPLLFCLLRSTQTCCYGPRPQFNQYLFIAFYRF